MEAVATQERDSLHQMTEHVAIAVRLAEISCPFPHQIWKYSLAGSSCDGHDDS